MLICHSRYSIFISFETQCPHTKHAEPMIKCNHNDPVLREKMTKIDASGAVDVSAAMEENHHRKRTFIIFLKDKK